MLRKTTAQAKIAKLRKRIRIVQGGTSSSKTFTILPMLITYAIQKPESEISVVSESVPHLKRGAIRDFIKIMQWTDNWRETSWNKTDKIYTFQNGSFIEFFGADQPDKMRGARRDVLFINECDRVQFEAYNQLAVRTRKFIYLDFNPTKEFYVHTELENRENSDKIILTYKDNEALESSIVKEIESARERAKTSPYWENWWKVYGLGLIGSLQGAVFNNWEIIDFMPIDDEGEHEARLLGIGLDFGYSNHPTAATAIYEWNGSYILDQIIYQKGLRNDQIAAILSEYDCEVVCDSAEPKSIEELRMHGIDATGAPKGKDSILFGIDIMQSLYFFVTARSEEIIKEFKYYTWKTDKSGKKMNVPIKHFDHAMDGIRYFIVYSKISDDDDVEIYTA